MNDDDNILKDPDFLFTIVATILKKYGGIIKLSEEDVLAVDMSDALGMKYDRDTGVITLRFVSADQIKSQSKSSSSRLKLVPELEDDDI